MTGAETGRGEPGRPEAAAPRDPVDMSLLTLLGLGADEDAVYRLLVDRPDSEPAGLAGPVSGPEAARVLDSLVERGLASASRPDADGTVRYRAASPVLALGPLLESRRSALHRVESLVGDLTERHRAAQSHASGAPVEVLSGPAAIRRRLLTMQRQARTEVCTLVPARRVPAVLSFEDNHEEVDSEMMDRGVTVRSVVEREWLEHPETAAVLASCVAQGQHISVTDRLPIKLAIVDRRVALLPLDPEREAEPVALVVHRTGLLTALVSLFEEHFEKGWRLSVSGTEEEHEAPVAAIDRQIVALLHVGLTDAAIARQLGMGHRTVQRRLHALMDEVGAATRFQLGWYAARAGWLPDIADNSGAPEGS
ncbi:helix-turn-helix transcriptional regulator [Streptomyces sp. NBC_00264]|uniref:helix-turn-helix transcriptional regulator n=1 Tax=unclassified Streptomyces TaxID=2593676 RepID=UPI0022589C8D|nr:MULTISPECIES: helix-turn-helix transcriptional regulator [unclassified Streptomyces]MCX4392356.1 helix-turn-helix transcriptional regulator [Streptomyces sp. NBC_01767]MCX5222990.1 helix-turn-helix transcriptional regulator [Streptomyces sp. NBC_00264]